MYNSELQGTPDVVKSLPHSWANAKLRLTIQTYEADKRLAKAIAANIAHYRKQAGLTQLELARMTGKKQPDIARQERSTYGRHTIHSLNKLAVALGVTVNDLVATDNQSQVEPLKSAQTSPPKKNGEG